MQMNYRKLTMKQMVDYIEEHHSDKESKAAFAAAAIKEHKEQMYVDVLDADGNPVKYVDKNGKVKVKKRRVEKPDGKSSKVKSVLDAKRYFYETYKDEIEFENAPKAKKEDELMAKLLSW